MSMSLAAALAVAVFADPPEGVLPKGADGHVLNLDFETGDLRDWTATGTAFAGQPVEGDLVARRRKDMRSQHQGRFWIGGFERAGDPPVGTLTSAPFKVTHGFASFLVGGGPDPKTRVELVRADNGRVVFSTSGVESESLERVVVDLFSHRGQEIFVRLVDEHTGHWGHLNFDDFRFHDRRPAVKDRGAAKADAFLHDGLEPEAAAKAMTVPPGFAVKLFAGEPDVRQPIAFTLDDRGRLWVAENETYPIHPKVPLTLKEGEQPTFKGKDRILVFEDIDGDGKFDKRSVVAEGFDHITGLEWGFGGLYVGAAPYLLHVPIKDDKPSGPPTVLLDGWGYQDMHETLNSFNWGPDGWLYGCHGVFTFSRVGKPGTPDRDRTPINAGIWRFHPVSKKFEVFAEGTSNPWGVDFNAQGDCFLTCCVIPHLFHVFQGGRFDRQAGSHYNPYAYDDIPTIAKHRHYVGSTPHGGNGKSDEAGGGHAHAGCLIYQGGTWPPEYHGKIFMNNIHGSRLNVDVVVPKGSGYVGDRQPDFLLANDRWSQILSLKQAPDGNVYFIDWYDRQQCHTNNPIDHRKGKGRIFKIVWTGKPALAAEGDAAAAEAKFGQSNDLGALAEGEWLALQTHPNQWFARHGRRLLQEKAAAGWRMDDGAKAALLARIDQAGPDEQRLPWLWAAHACGLLDRETIAKRLIEPGPAGAAIKSGAVGKWLVHLVADTLADEPAGGAPMRVAVADASVRRAVAAALARFPAEQRFDVLAGLLEHAEDADDHNLPTMYWYAAEPLAAVDAGRALALANGGGIPKLSRFMGRRVAALGTPEAFQALAAAAIAAAPDRGALMLQGWNEALAGQRRLAAPANWAEAYAKLSASADTSVREHATALAVKFGDRAAFAALRKLAADAGQPAVQRNAALATLAAARDPELLSALLPLFGDAAVRRAALRSAGGYDDPRIAPAILGAFAGFSTEEKRDALNTLAAREKSALALLVAVGAKKVARDDLSADVVRQLQTLRSAAVDAELAKSWGLARQTSADAARRIAELKAQLAKPAPQPADPSLGRAVFAKACAQCHALFAEGAKTAPDLTGSNRRNLEYVLANVVDPSAVVGKDYLATIFRLNDGRTITAIVKAEDDKTLTLITANETLAIPKADVEQRRQTTQSLMPEKLLDTLADHELRSLLEYLASPAQVPLPPGLPAAKK